MFTLNKNAGSLCYYLQETTVPDCRKKNDTETKIDRKAE